ncbi:Cell elongation protein, putative [Candida maltosa Xu316]|uniref:Cell elongation protein, putative n=1 Tax=Candida maltosa (strain Xu316) TaxID=1245528 RepID=M3HEZ2_CANMX|nr:Cell elongation protein, putative [Candida maltosa Xu316]
MKFAKIASFAFFALATQAAVITYDTDLGQTKRDIIYSESVTENVSEAELAKRASVSGLISGIITNLPQLFQIISSILKSSGLVKRDDVDNAVGSLIDDLPQILNAVDTALTTVSYNKRTTNDAVSNVISQFPDIISQIVAGVDQTSKNAGDNGVEDIGLTLVSNLPAILSNVIGNVSQTVENAKRDGVEDIVTEVVDQLPSIIAGVSGPILQSAEKFKREEDSSVFVKLAKKGISTGVKTFGVANVANVLSKRSIGSFITNLFTKA